MSIYRHFRLFEGVLANPAEPTLHQTETLTFGLLPDSTDRHVHAVYDLVEPCPLTVCGLRVIPDISMAPHIYRAEVLLCRCCLAALPDGAELRPAADERRRHVQRVLPDGCRPLVTFESWRLANVRSPLGLHTWAAARPAGRP
ncbi:hypothetical protein [Pseudonocardia acaciae]|uniref:hypothetical protein n=1 Tax=Pseudonocardia acaciae TaxID=551276 RepID=UPI00048EC6D4|nr:hypothetical protein [Pseudonocardia acaciae]